VNIAEQGFIRCFFWAFFSWRGEIRRLPYALAFFGFVLLARIYASAAAQWLAVTLLPPPGNVAPDPAYVTALASTTAFLPFLLPVCYCAVVLDLKRLRSIGAPAFLAFLLSGLTPLVPFFAPSLTEMTALSSFAYHAILAVIPAKEDRLDPQEKKARTWKRIATGDGSPRRLRGKDIKEWRIVRQGPAKTE
jgi:uncharacterized membrane protein YhaH (DUF805 family)